MTYARNIKNFQASATTSWKARIAARMIPVMTALMAFGAMFGWAGGAEARQCVWNKGWFVLNVKWYDPDALVVVNRLDGGKDVQVVGNARPLAEDQFPAAQGRCFTHPQGKRAIAVLRVWGGDFAIGLTKVTVGALVAAGTAAVGATTCAGTAGAGCAATAAGGGAIIGGAVSAIPNRSEVFDFVVPRTDRWTDVWGTAFHPVANINVGGRF